jgi:hypothetical protein
MKKMSLKQTEPCQVLNICETTLKDKNKGQAAQDGTKQQEEHELFTGETSQVQDIRCA